LQRIYQKELNSPASGVRGLFIKITLQTKNAGGIKLAGVHINSPKIHA
jgi:hypothetical protein